jgi:hypothetical protein
MKFVVRDTIFSAAADEIKALILQVFNTKIGHSNKPPL